MQCLIHLISCTWLTSVFAAWSPLMVHVANTDAPQRLFTISPMRILLYCDINNIVRKRTASLSCSESCEVLPDYINNCIFSRGLYFHNTGLRTNVTSTKGLTFDTIDSPVLQSSLSPMKWLNKWLQWHKRLLGTTHSSTCFYSIVRIFIWTLGDKGNCWLVM